MQLRMSVAAGVGERTKRRAKEGAEKLRQAPELPCFTPTDMRALN